MRSHITAWLETQGVALPSDARIQLLALPRFLGYVFNPVSFFFCWTASGQPLCAIAEVQNTFGELKPYLVPLDPSSVHPGEKVLESLFRGVMPKHFYVSPFSAANISFDFRLRSPGDRLEIGVNDLSASGTDLVSTLTGIRRPLTDQKLLRLTTRYPLVTLRVILLIHWHALRLWWMGLPWHPKSANPHLQQHVFRPHRSIQSMNVPEEPTSKASPQIPTISR